jgi:hypothetical protein
MLTGTVQRIKLGRVCTVNSPMLGEVDTVPAAEGSDCEHTTGFVCGFGKRPTGARGGLRLAAENGESTAPEGDFVWKQLPKVVEELQRHSLHIEGGPYADKDDVIAHFAETIFTGIDPKDVRKLIGRVIDARPAFEMSANLSDVLASMMVYANNVPRYFTSGYSFVYSESFEGFVPPDELPSSGEVLSQHRVRENTTHGGMEFGLIHPMEYYLIAVAALRRLGHQAYPALAVVPGPDGGEFATPSMVVIDMKAEVPLTTFNPIFVSHPNAGAFDILSDEAVMGAVHAMRAEYRVRHLLAEMVEKTGFKYDEGAIDTQLYRISRSLFESAKRWSGKETPGISVNPFIGKTFGMLGMLTTEAILHADMEAHRVAGAPPEILQALAGHVDNIRSSGMDPEGIVVEDPQSPDGQVVLAAKEIVLDMYRTSGAFVEKVQTLLGIWITAAKE